LFSIAGIPPMAGFLSKIFILLEIFKNFYGNDIVVVLFFIVLSSISVFYYLRLIKIIVFEPHCFKNENCQMIFYNSNLDNVYTIIVVLIMILLFGFVFPTIFILLSQYIILNIS
jgi:NADH:ubiquinone oxidoreductase subunit 2 (subunit N)